MEQKMMQFSELPTVVRRAATVYLWSDEVDDAEVVDNKVKVVFVNGQERLFPAFRRVGVAWETRKPNTTNTVLRKGKTQRDKESGAKAQYEKNKKERASNNRKYSPSKADKGGKQKK